LAHRPKSNSFEYEKNQPFGNYVVAGIILLQKNLSTKNIAMKKILISLCFFIGSLSAFAQLSLLSKIPGNFVIDAGLGRLNNAPASMDLKTLDSRSLNLYFMYRLRISDHFSFHPGLGIGNERYSFSNNNHLAYSLVRGIAMAEVEGSKRSVLAAHYLDIPVELRFAAGQGRNTFKIAAGLKGGLLIDSKNKTRVELPDGKIVNTKVKQDFYLQRFRVAPYARIGYGAYHLFASYNLSSLFRNGNAPEGADINSFMLGISVVAF
jgi:hypothetical protein